MSKNRKVDIDKEVRNINFTLNPKRMNINRKLFLTSIVTFIIMLLYESKTTGIYRDYFYMEILGFFFIFVFSTFFVEYIDFIITTHYMLDGKKSVMIGYSNLVTVYDGTYPDSNLISRVYSADKIKIRKCTDEDLDNFYPLCTSVIECYTNGEAHTKIGVRRVKKLEGLELYPDNEKGYLDIFSVVSCEEDCNHCTRRAFCDECKGNCEDCIYKILCDSCNDDCINCEYRELCDSCNGNCETCESKKDCISCYDTCKIEGTDEICPYFEECKYKNFWKNHLEEQKNKKEKLDKEDENKENENIDK